MITKLYEKKYGCQPKNEVESAAAPAAPKEKTPKDKKNHDDDGISDDYDDDFDTDLLEDKKKQEMAKNAAKNKDAASDDGYEEDEWGMDDDWGDLDDIKDKNKKGGAGQSAKPTAMMDDLDILDDLPEIGSNFPQKNEDKFN